MLHIANTDKTAGSLRLGRVPGEVIAWNDELYEGPVPAGLSHQELSKQRAEFLFSSGWREPRALREEFLQRYGDRRFWLEHKEVFIDWPNPDDVRGQFLRRDGALQTARDHDEVVLWFAHDLNDQLRLIQILAWFAEHAQELSRLTLVQSPDYLGSMRKEGLKRLFPKRQPVATGQLALGATAWEAFRQPDPTALVELLDGDTSALPFLDGALLRLLEQYPSTHNGLSRSEQCVLRGIEAERQRLTDIFIHTWLESEERPFLSDLSLQSLVSDLEGGSAPRLEIRRTEKRWPAWRAALTDAGRSVIESEADAIELRGLDRWVGGVHLHGHQVSWRWNKEDLRLETVGSA